MVRRTSCFLAIFLPAAVAALGIDCAGAQQDPPILQLAAGPFVEDFAESGAASGAKGIPTAAGDRMRVLVGLHLGEAKGPFEIRHVGVLLKPDEEVQRYCVRIATVTVAPSLQYLPEGGGQERGAVRPDSIEIRRAISA
jgi:hypothetical protein